MSALTPGEQDALLILQHYEPRLDRTAPERTIHECREYFLAQAGQDNLPRFTAAMKILLEKRYVRRLNDERLELSDPGREWYLAHTDAA